ncbi:hypothetical protein JX265_011706 [Neoarthrinium moseri]|uniref:Cytochrome P450 n=1 Tax=Neoarthrinium moseri TaxID=1658444 RepID=A0A9P9WC12_9PEZI|nr:hypothetical protein JX265_011706 [Neoarthrinium moseri]
MFLLSFLVTAVGLGVVVLVLRAIYYNLVSPINGIPGPLPAKYTDLWRLFDFYNGTQIETQRRLHERFGTATDFYSVNDAMQDGRRIQNVFSTRDKEFHAKYMRPIHNLFSLRGILSFEHLSDKTLLNLCQQLESRFVDGDNAGRTCDIADWIEFFCWDVDGEMTFGQDMGFLEAGKDEKGMIHTSEQCQRYFGIVGQMPWLDMWLGKNPRCSIMFPTFAQAAGYCVQRLLERQSSQRPKDILEDFMDHYIQAKTLNPGVVTDHEVIGYLILNVLAGADTTAIVTKVIVYNVLSNPAIYGRLRAELDAATLSYPATYEEVHGLKYLDAVMKEGMRIHPVLGNMLERIVPEGGLTLSDGRIIAPGVFVGMNPWLLHHNKDVYGQDAGAFRPERWLRHEFETQEAYEIRLKRMKDTDLTFGAGSRICVGKNFAQVELVKTVATLFHRYDMELVPGVKQWTPRWWWFTYVDHIRVRLRRRTSSGG